MSATKSLPNGVQKNGQKITQKNVMPFTAKIEKKIEKTITQETVSGTKTISQKRPHYSQNAAPLYFKGLHAG